VNSVTLDKASERILQAAREKQAGTDGCLWPAPYNEDTVESALAFAYQCRTWDPTDTGLCHIPDLPHLRAFAQAWFRVKSEGGTLIVEKCRRMVVSWMARALELHQFGLSRKSWVLSGETFGPACKHVWRYEHLYLDLKKQFPQWKLPAHHALHFEGPESLKQFGLANGSVCVAMNGQGSNIQGEGLSGVTMEEASLYPYLQEMLGQARIVTQGKPGMRNGFVTLIANPEPNYAWQVVKSGGKDFVV